MKKQGFCNKCGYVGECEDVNGILKHYRRDGKECAYSAGRVNGEPAIDPMMERKAAAWDALHEACKRGGIVTGKTAETETVEHLLDKVVENKRLRSALTAKDAEIARLREALETIAKPSEQSFYILRHCERVLCAEWSAVQWRMDAADRALTTTPATTRTDGADAGHPAEGRM